MGSERWIVCGFGMTVGEHGFFQNDVEATDAEDAVAQAVLIAGNEESVDPGFTFWAIPEAQATEVRCIRDYVAEPDPEEAEGG